MLEGEVTVDGSEGGVGTAESEDVTAVLVEAV